MYEINLHKAAALCSKSEHCENDIYEKLLSYGSSEAEAAKIVQYLVAEKYISNERYAVAFVRDKFRFSKWGRIKIAYALRQKKIESALIQTALQEIDDDEYLCALRELLQDKKRHTKAKDKYDMQAKLFRFAASRGFESEAIQNALRNND